MTEANRLLIDGVLAAGSGTVVEVADPATGEVIPPVPTATGLGASIYTLDAQRVEWASKELQVGNQ